MPCKGVLSLRGVLAPLSSPNDGQSRVRFAWRVDLTKQGESRCIPRRQGVRPSLYGARLRIAARGRSAPLAPGVCEGVRTRGAQPMRLEEALPGASIETLHLRASYGGRKGRRAARRLNAMGLTPQFYRVGTFPAGKEKEWEELAAHTMVHGGKLRDQHYAPITEADWGVLRSKIP